MSENMASTAQGPLARNKASTAATHPWKKNFILTPVVFRRLFLKF